MNQVYKNCQSCGMPLSKDEQGGGTNTDGSKSTMYCSRCFDKGFINHDIDTAAKMQDFVINRLKEKGFPSFLAWLLTRGIPKLERWVAHEQWERIRAARGPLPSKADRELIQEEHVRAYTLAEGKGIDALTAGQRGLRAMLVLEGDVDNGGFTQLFFNTRDEFAPDAAKGYRLFGLTERALIVEEALKQYRLMEQAFEATRTKSDKLLKKGQEREAWEVFVDSYEGADFGAVDQRFFELPHPDAAQAAYIRSHPDEFPQG